MTEFFESWLLLVAVFTLAVVSPGPDFIMAVRNSIMGSRKAGLLTAVGFGLGVCIHVAYCLAGLALIISQSVLLFNIIKVIGAGYLFCMGYQALKSKGFDGDVSTQQEQAVRMSNWDALKSGFITNLFNPKATLFFLALFTQILSPDIAMAQKAVFGMTCVILTVLWFSVVSIVLTTPKIRSVFLRCAKWVDRACGVLFIALGMKLVFTKLQ